MVISNVAKILMLFGAVLFVLGIVFTFGAKIPWIGRLPGDIYIQKKNFSFYFPIMTSIVISIILSVVLIFIRRK